MVSLLNSRKKYNAQPIIDAYEILTKPASLCSIVIITVPNFLDYYWGRGMIRHTMPWTTLVNLQTPKTFYGDCNICFLPAEDTGERNTGWR